MVIVMEGSRETKDPGEDSAMPLVHEQINTYIKEGLTTNEAIKRDVYKRQMGKKTIRRFSVIVKRGGNIVSLFISEVYFLPCFVQSYFLLS